MSREDVAVSEMGKDLLARMSVYTDTQHRDTSAKGPRWAHRYGEQQAKEKEAVGLAARLDFLSTALRRQTRITDPLTDDPCPVYRSQKRRTTRPIGLGSLTAKVLRL